MLLLLNFACTGEVEVNPRHFPKGQRPLDTAVEVDPRLSRVTRTVELPNFSGFSSPIDDTASLDSGFGPRRLSLDGARTDFHTGVDLDAPLGTPVYAIADATVFRIDDDGDSGGRTLYLELTVPPFDFHGETVEHLYVVYSHLHSFAVSSEGEPVSEGQVVGAVGDSGGVFEPHLHLELRIGTHCSLEYATDNPDSDCGRHYDPAVNPFHVIPGYQPEVPTVTVLNAEPLVLRVSTRTSDQDLNRVASDQGLVDLDLRMGIDATSEEAMDNLDYGWLQLDPELEHEDPGHTRWFLTFASEPEWVEVLDIRGEGWRLDL